MTASVADRLDLYSMPEPNSGCWLWIGGDNERYGVLWISGRLQRAHRLSWEASYGPIPSGLKVLHECDIPRCINPAHLFLGTQSDNLLDCSRKGRMNLAACASNARKTHCPRGHAYTPENTLVSYYSHDSTRRRCRKCRHAQQTSRYGPQKPYPPGDEGR